MVATLPRPAVSIDEQDLSREDQIALLFARLDNGWALIERAKRDGEDVRRWESSWLRMLRRYEELCDAA